jgi:hypothetical protein
MGPQTASESNAAQAAPLEITATDSLSLPQRQEAERLSARLNGRFQPSAALSAASIHFRPDSPGLPGRLIYFPESRRILAYWPVAPEEGLESALAGMAEALPLLQLADDPLSRVLAELPPRSLADQKREVLAYWSGPYAKGAHWQARLQLPPAWYARWDAAPLVRLLNERAPLPEASRSWSKILLTYQAFSPAAHPDEGLFRFLPAEGALLIHVPLPLESLERFAAPPAAQSHLLRAMLLSFLALQRDPEIPGLAFAAWRERLEMAIGAGRD